jgi:hypothetical protein
MGAMSTSFVASAQHDHLGADTDTTIEIDHILVGHAEASRLYGLADGLGFVQSVNAVERGTEIYPDSMKIREKLLVFGGLMDSAGGHESGRFSQRGGS